MHAANWRSERMASKRKRLASATAARYRRCSLMSAAAKIMTRAKKIKVAKFHLFPFCARLILSRMMFLPMRVVSLAN